MPAVAHIALLDEGNVLTVDGRLPTLEADEDNADHEDERFMRALDLVGADIYLAPMLRIEEDHYLDVVGCRALPAPSGTWVPAGELADRAVAELLT